MRKSLIGLALSEWKSSSSLVITKEKLSSDPWTPTLKSRKGKFRPRYLSSASSRFSSTLKGWMMLSNLVGHFVRPSTSRLLAWLDYCDYWCIVLIFWGYGTWWPLNFSSSWTSKSRFSSPLLIIPSLEPVVGLVTLPLADEGWAYLGACYFAPLDILDWRILMTCLPLATTMFYFEPKKVP